jgi:hypothetical protein
VYIDIEGFELEALRGASKTLCTQATFVIEVHAGHQLQEVGGSVGEIDDLLVTSGRRIEFNTDEDWWVGVPLRAVSEKCPLPQDERFFMLATRHE